MSNNFDDPFSANLIGLWDFLNTGPKEDTGLADGVAQNGHLQGDASISDEALHTGGCGMFEVNGGNDAPFNLAQGTIAVEFTQDNHIGSSPDTIVNRGEQADYNKEGWFEISVTRDGAVQVWHADNGLTANLTTGPGFFDEGDTVKASYSWSPEGGLTFEVSNLTQNTDVTVTADNPGLTMDVTDDDDESWTFGAREVDDGRYGNHFDGSIDYVAVYNTDIATGGGLAPEAENDAASGDEDTAIIIDVLGNDSDPDGDPLSVTEASDGANGTTSINPDGTITYTPDPDFNGEDTFSYTISDGDGGTDTATVTVTVAPVNDDPEANPDTASGDEDTDIVIDVLANDTDVDGDPLTVIETTDGANGTTSINPDGTITYTPDPDFNGVDTFSYTINDGSDGFDTATVTVTVGPVNDPPEANDDSATTGFQADVVIDVLGNDSDADGDPLTVTAADDGANGTTTINPDGSISYTPDAGFTGDDTFSYTISDGQGGTDTATVTVSVGPDLRDGIVDGTTGDDLIDIAYTGDPEGDRIDAMDEILPGEGPNDDIVRAGRGDDTVLAGDGDDDVRGGGGDDLIFGGVGADELAGNRGADTLIGGAGDDTITGGRGADDLLGGADQDTFTGITAGDVVDGNETGVDFDTLDLTGSAQSENPGGGLRVTYTSPDQEDGFVEFLDAGGDVTGTMQFANIENVIPCFTPNTVIATPRGEQLVQNLSVGDRVITRDNGLQEIRWIGKRSLSGAELQQAPHLKPILVRAGSLGLGLPERDLLVSPQHRILVNNDKTALYFEEREVLAAAKHLTGMDGVDEVTTSGTTYIHFMFDQHEVVLSNGSWTESFQPGDQVLDGMSDDQRDEIYDLFPELRHQAGLHAYQAARKSLKRHEARLLVK
ncbi:Ig-like domain-containing protein [uncultured Roseovarius sp.]|uniref:Ig-like domain-containing protein n=1 Tax=uncultured Roseovarius sp. TaxID=293344 RepID=UPI0026219DAE|nr:Ig-like domain-containing protein [uncultured Roseovarius sp.]